VRRSRTGKGRPKAAPPERPDPRAAADTVVTLIYRLYDEAGELCDTASREAPLRYVHGYAQIIPGLERGLDGAKRGERRRIELDPEEAFGERDEQAILEIDKRDFPDAARAEVGDEILATAPDGTECSYRILAITDSDIIADRNHPLAGKRVRFDVEVVDVRPAREREIADAQAEVDDRIVGANTIVYGSEPADADGNKLIQLRAKGSQS
jgi:FKBP-type peptidyl-prolyl cis-trans isomerase SlyD